MKIVNIYCLLLFISFSAKAQSLRWLDIEKKSVYRIDIKKSVLEKSSNSIEWQEIGKAELKNIQEKDILQLYEINCLNTEDKNLVYLLVECTSQVYQFNYQTLILERIDKTYFGGFNCRSKKFIRNNTIYSAGGYGLFRSNNLLIYYQKDRHEWDAINFLNDAPKSIFKGFSGYVKKTDSFFTGFNDFVSVSENIGKDYTDFGFYEYKFKENKWYKLGEIKQTVLRNIKKENYQYFHWNGKYFIFRIFVEPFSHLVIVDPFLNEVYEWIDKEKLFYEEIPTELEYEYVHEDSLFSYKIFKTNNRNTTEKFTISIEETKKQATYIGKMYEAENNNFWLLLIATGISLMIVSFVIYNKFFKNKNIKKYVFLGSNALNSLEIKMIKVLMKNYEKGGMSSEQISALLEINDKNIDNQRKLRHEFIKSLNLKLKMMYNFENSIERNPSSTDKRIFDYQLNEEIFKKLKKNLKTIK
jgi:NADPH-dependent 7-cyano-7-deazaguanine reductase QueF-like protein